MSDANHDPSEAAPPQSVRYPQTVRWRRFAGRTMWVALWLAIAVMLICLFSPTSYMFTMDDF